MWSVTHAFLLLYFLFFTLLLLSTIYQQILHVQVNVLNTRDGSALVAIVTKKEAIMFLH